MDYKGKDAFEKSLAEIRKMNMQIDLHEARLNDVYQEYHEDFSIENLKKALYYCIQFEEEKDHVIGTHGCLLCPLKDYKRTKCRLHLLEYVGRALDIVKTLEES